MSGERIPESFNETEVDENKPPDFSEPEFSEAKVQLDDGLDMLDRAATRPENQDKQAVQAQAQLHLLASIAVSLYETSIVAKNLDERLVTLLELLELLSSPQHVAGIQQKTQELEQLRELVQEEKERMARAKPEEQCPECGHLAHDGLYCTMASTKLGSSICACAKGK